MSDEEYNGWTNRETWAVKLHLDNTEAAQLWARELVTFEPADAAHQQRVRDAIWTPEQSKVFYVEDALREAVEAAFAAALNPDFSADNPFDDCEAVIGLDTQEIFSMIADVGSLWRVNWREIAEHIVEEASEG